MVKAIVRAVGRIIQTVRSWIKGLFTPKAVRYQRKRKVVVSPNSSRPQAA